MEDSMWMDNLEEFVFEERKAVTYKWLSRALNVHVNVAKQMLFAFAEKNSGKVDLVYLVAGAKDKNILVKLVKDRDLAEVEASFDKLSSKHIHTIAAKDESGKLLSEVNVLNVELATRKEFKPTTAYSGIINKKATPRPSKRADEDEGRVAATTSAVAKVEIKEEKKETTSKAKTGGSIEQMFGKQKEKEPATAKPAAAASEKPVATTTKAAPAKKTSAIAGMFAKQVAAGPVVKKVVKKEEESDEDEKMSPVNSPGKENRMNQEKERKEKEERERKEKAAAAAAAKKRPSKNSSAGNQSKRRKRIQVASDSDSSDAENVDDPEPVMVDSPPPPQAARIDSDDEDEDIIPATPVDKNGSKKGRVKKMRKKTYVDEDGFLVTKTEMASGTDDSEDEKKPGASGEEKDDKKTLESPAVSKISPKKDAKKSDSGKKTSATNSGSAGKSKQASIMNFFSKK